MSDCEYSPEQGNKDSGGDYSVDLSVRQAQGDELEPRCDAMLPPGQREDLGCQPVTRWG